MTTYGFEIACKRNLMEIIRERYHEEYKIGDLHVVWFSKTLQNMKSVLVDNGPNNRIYECTLNGEKNEIYFDLYDKDANYVRDAKPRYIDE